MFSEEAAALNLTTGHQDPDTNTDTDPLVVDGEHLRRMVTRVLARTRNHNNDKVSLLTQPFRLKLGLLSSKVFIVIVLFLFHHGITNG